MSNKDQTAAALSGEAYPLYWPEGWPRTAYRRNAPYRVDFVTARDDLAKSLQLMGAKRLVVSTNIPIRRDKLPLANFAEPTDPGVAVYWFAGGHERVIACDQWRRVKDNMRAAGLAIDALRALQRSGASQVLDRAFVGLTALAANNPRRTWREVFSLKPSETPTRTNLDTLYRSMLLERHPDHGGKSEDLQELIAAYQDALNEVAA